jgi:tRNA A-37 threonylcarbamoyl transferase component Bud32
MPQQGGGMEINMTLDRIIAVRTGKTIYRDADKAIKVFDNDYSKSDILNEALNQARVEETGLNIPKIIEVTKIQDKWAIVTEFIEGKTLSQLMQENPEKFDEYLNMFIDLQMTVHSKKAPLLNKLKDKMKRKIAQADLNATTRYDLHTRLEAMPKHDKVCHGDFNPSNIIISKDGIPFILDWSHATQGNASADAARTYLLFWLAGDINGAEKYLNLFCEKSDTAKQYIQKWLPIVAASQSVKGNPKEREFLLSWVDVVDYQ